MWLTSLVAVVLSYFVYHLAIRVHKLEMVRGPGSFLRLNINVVDALIEHRKFGEITGIKSASEGKKFEDWTKADKDKYNEKWEKQVWNGGHVELTYLPGENAYFVSNENVGQRIRNRTIGPNTILSTVVVGDRLGKHLEFRLVEHYGVTDLSKNKHVLKVILSYHEDGHTDGNSETLCVFPVFEIFNQGNQPSVETDSKFKKLGFQVDRRSELAAGIYESFGASEMFVPEIVYKQNGVVISFD